MRVKLTPDQKFRKRWLDKHIYLAKLYPEQYRIKYQSFEEEMVISLFARDKHMTWELCDYIVLEFGNNIPWLWQQKLQNGNKS